jgi:hypothetical protein
LIERLSLQNEAVAIPMRIPISAARRMITATDASNFHERKATATGVAFCREKMTMTATTTMTITGVIIFSPFLLALCSVKLPS